MSSEEKVQAKRAKRGGTRRASPKKPMVRRPWVRPSNNEVKRALQETKRLRTAGGLVMEAADDDGAATPG